MYEYELENEDKDLKKVGLELMFMTPEKCEKPDGITSIELAKLVGLPVEVVKKKLNILKEAEVVRVKGINPKYWKFDEYNFQRMDEQDEIFKAIYKRKLLNYHLGSYIDISKHEEIRNRAKQEAALKRSETSSGGGEEGGY